MSGRGAAKGLMRSAEARRAYAEETARLEEVNELKRKLIAALQASLDIAEEEREYKRHLACAIAHDAAELADSD